MKLRLKNITFIFAIVIAGITFTEAAGNRCCCNGTSSYFPDTSACMVHPQTGKPAFKSFCCCDIKAAECNLPQTFSILPAVTAKIEPVQVTYETDSAIFSEFLNSFTSRKSSDDPPPLFQLSYTTIPLYLLNCSILC